MPVTSPCRSATWRSTVVGGMVWSAAVVLAAMCIAPASTYAATQAQIDRAIARGVKYLSESNASEIPGRSGLAAYALMKAGVKTDSPFVQECLAEVLAKIGTDGYRPRTHHLYEAGVDLMALEAADPDAYQGPMRDIAVYIVSEQFVTGQWYYPGGQNPQGDTSISQYALLGLWAAYRSGIKISPEVWDRAARWHIQTQRPDGGAAYHPHEREASKNSTTAASVGSMALCRRLIPFKSGSTPAAKPRVMKFGFLSPTMTETSPEDRAFNPATNPRGLDESINRGLDWLGRNYSVHKPPEEWAIYFLYGVERLVAIGELDTLAGRDWYADGADFLVRTQDEDGSWQEKGNSGSDASTSFALLFLTKATSTLIKPKKPQFAGGLQIGGRGLPSDLDGAAIGGGAANTKESATSVEQLLARLQGLAEQAAGADVDEEDVTAALVEQVQRGDRETLVREFDLLARVVSHAKASPQVRQTAAWALGRTKKLEAARYLLQALNDKDWGVVGEAHRALCVLSRQPDGLGLGLMLPGDDDDASIPARTTWRKQAVDRWTAWYLEYRPYDERDDRFELRESVK